jgi:hypothetical protein
MVCVDACFLYPATANWYCALSTSAYIEQCRDLGMLMSHRGPDFASLDKYPAIGYVTSIFLTAALPLSSKTMSC